MSTPKFDKEQQAYIDNLLAQQSANFDKKLDLRLEQERVNSVELAATILETKQIVGKPIIDDETKEQKVVDGIPQTYPDKYFASLTFDGGSMEAEISQSQFESLEVSKRYLCKGYVGDVRVFANKTMVMVKGVLVKTFTRL